MKNQVKLCLMGFGNASQALCKIIIEQRDKVKEKYGVEIIITGIATRSKGCLLDGDGIDLSLALKTMKNLGSLESLSSCYKNMLPMDLIKASNADALLEMSALSIYDGQPAIQYIETALDLNMHVISANKGPIAWAYDRLKKKAEASALQFLFETTVMDGTPVFNLVKKTLPGCEVIGFKGILNSTTNFILEEMEKGFTYDTALKEAQRRGFAEADPSMDVDGWDAAAKTTVLANVLMNANLTPLDIDRTGIQAISKEAIDLSLAKGKKYKLLCEGYVENGKVKGKVSPVLVDVSDILSTIDATSSLLSITTDLMGEIMIVEKNPEIEQTGYGLFSDVLTMMNHIL